MPRVCFEGLRPVGRSYLSVDDVGRHCPSKWATKNHHGWTFDGRRSALPPFQDCERSSPGVSPMLQFQYKGLKYGLLRCLQPQPCTIVSEMKSIEQKRSERVFCCLKNGT